MAAPPPTPSADRSEPSSRRTTVLVCDDDRLVLLTLVSALRGAGYDVVEADNGDDAILLARQHRPDIALLDIRMDGKSGLDVASYLRDYVGTPFMFLSAFSEESFIRKAREFGALDYLVKPVDIEKIPLAVAAALHRARDLAGVPPHRNGPMPAMPDAGAAAHAPGAASPAAGQAMPGAPVTTRVPVASAGSLFAADIGAADLALPRVGPAASVPDQGPMPAGVAFRSVALGIMMERFRLTLSAAQARLADSARRSGRAEDAIAEEFVRGIDALNATGERRAPD